MFKNLYLILKLYGIQRRLTKINKKKHGLQLYSVRCFKIKLDDFRKKND